MGWCGNRKCDERWNKKLKKGDEKMDRGAVLNTKEDWHKKGKERKEY